MSKNGQNILVDLSNIWKEITEIKTKINKNEEEINKLNIILRWNIKMGGDKMTKAEIIEEEDQPGFPVGLIASFLPGSWGTKYECSNCEAELEGDEDTCPECGAELRH